MESTASFLKRTPKKGKKNDNLELNNLGTLLSFSHQPFASEQAQAQQQPSAADREKLKDKVVSATINVWNNVKYGFSLPYYRPSFSESSNIWLLGKCYDSRRLDEVDYAISRKEENRILQIDEFFEEFASLIWLTYRKEFPQLQNSTLTTDCGWGCMLRTGQMILANTLLVHFLKKSWRKASREGSIMEHHYRMILRFFNDEPSDCSPFSLHQLVKIGQEIGRKAGDWYGPGSVAHILSIALKRAMHPYLEGICIYVAQDCTVYKEDVIKLATQCVNCTAADCRDKTWRSVLILVPVRLGGEGFNPIYAPCIKTLLTLNHCIGIIGGRPKHSLYFVGFQDNKLLHLDPHYLQPKVDMSSDDFPVNSYHCPIPKKMSIRKMDPSCCIGFYCRKREDFDEFQKETVNVLKPPMQRLEYPMFIFENGSSRANELHTGVGSTPVVEVPSALGSFSWEAHPKDTPDGAGGSRGSGAERRDRKEHHNYHSHKHSHRKHRKKKDKEAVKRDIDDYIVVE
eukprot:gene8211-9091_t